MYEIDDIVSIKLLFMFLNYLVYQVTDYGSLASNVALQELS